MTDQRARRTTRLQAAPAPAGPAHERSEPAAPARAEAGSSPPSPLLGLQRAIGNRTVGALLHQRPGVAPERSPRPVNQPPALLPRRRTRRLIQRFEEDEHLRVGDQGASEATAQRVKLADDYSITYGEMVAMGGDHFQSIAQMRDFARNTGTGAGTREEIEYVRVVKIRGQKGRAGEFSADAVKAADQRYYTLALNNPTHFPTPGVGDEKKSIPERSSDFHKEYVEWQGLLPRFVDITVPHNAGTAYRLNHFQAMHEAYFAGLLGEDVSAALAVEAFGAHFLTDSFSSGHLRTARASAKEYWNQRVPMFNTNIKGYIAEVLAERLEKTIYWGILSEEAVYHGALGQEGALETVSKTLDAKGFFTFGDVVSGAVHDYDNQRGVLVTIEGEEMRLFGDNMLRPGGRQESIIMDAVNLSHHDVIMAWLLGQKHDTPLAVLAAVLKDGLFAAERLLPQVKEDAAVGAADQSTKWEFPTVDALLGDSQFATALKVFCDRKAGEFETTAKELKDAAKEKAFMEGIVTPLRADPVAVMKQVIAWTPDTGGGWFGHNQDDNALEYVQTAKATGALATLSLSQKLKLINNLLDGATIGDEEDAIMDLLKADVGHARSIIASVGWERLHDDIDDWAGNDFADTFPERIYGP